MTTGVCLQNAKKSFADLIDMTITFLLRYAETMFGEVERAVNFAR